MVRRSTWLGGVAVGIAAVITACATIVGVEDAQVDPTIGQPEAGTMTSSSSSSGDPIDSGGQVEAGSVDSGPPCAGKECPCTRSADCIDPVFSACEKGQCRECTTVPDSCPADQYCEPTTLSCAPGCKNDQACPGQRCKTELHRCVDCLGEGDCTAPKTCTPSGVCASPCSGGCPNGTTCCGTVCVDLKTDRLNCKSCGAACTGASPLCCNGTCADTAIDELNCGKCGTTCSTVDAVPTCTAGSCTFQCTAGFTHCKPGNSGCDVRTSDNVKQCGGCAIDCNMRILNATGVSCANSACDYTTCAPGFVDADGNRANGCEAPCGGLNQACCAGATPCKDAGNRCDTAAKKCVPCLNKHSPCSTGNDLCCNFCNGGSGQCG